jgi:hypothetical protein
VYSVAAWSTELADIENIGITVGSLILLYTVPEIELLPVWYRGPLYNVGSSLVGLNIVEIILIIY